MASARLLAAVFSVLVIGLGVAACGSDETTTVTETAAAASGEATDTETGTGEAADEEIAAPDAEAQKDIDSIVDGIEETAQSRRPSIIRRFESGGQVIPRTTFEQAASGLQNARYCASNVIAGPNTSCAFALNVAYDYFTLGRAKRFVSYSPTTGKYYRVLCKGIHPTICRAGNGALIGIA